MSKSIVMILAGVAIGVLAGLSDGNVRCVFCLISHLWFISSFFVEED